MQLDVTQQQCHNSTPSEEDFWGLIVLFKLESIPQPQGECMGFCVIPEAIGSFGGSVFLLEIGIHA